MPPGRLCASLCKESRSPKTSWHTRGRTVLRTPVPLHRSDDQKRDDRATTRSEHKIPHLHQQWASTWSLPSEHARRTPRRASIQNFALLDECFPELFRAARTSWSGAPRRYAGRRPIRNAALNTANGQLDLPHDFGETRNREVQHCALMIRPASVPGVDGKPSWLSSPVAPPPHECPRHASLPLSIPGTPCRMSLGRGLRERQCMRHNGKHVPRSVATQHSNTAPLYGGGAQWPTHFTRALTLPCRHLL